MSEDEWVDPLVVAYRMVAPLPERVCLLDMDTIKMYAIGWSISDLLVEVEDGDGNIEVTGAPLRGWTTHAPGLYSRIPREILESLWKARPAESTLKAHEDILYGRSSSQD